MASSHLGCRTWLIALYLVTISLKGIASTKLAADLAITQKTAWHLAMRIRETYNRGHSVLTGEVEIDESYFGGAVSKMSPKKRKLLKGKGPRAGKQIIIGAKERDTGKIITHPIPNTKAPMLEGFVHYAVDNSAQVYTDDNNSYNQLAALGYKHKKVNHSAKQYVDGMASTQGIESFWALMKRGYHGIHHFMSFKHLGRYAREFAGKQADRKLDTMTQMELMAKAMTGKQLSFTMLKGC